MNRTDMQKDLWDKVMLIKRLTEDLEEEISRDREQVLAPARKRIIEIVRKIARQMGIGLVVKASSAVWVEPPLDMTSEVVTAYDKAYPFQ